MRRAMIVGTGSYVPGLVVTNDDLAALVETDDAWISSRTGIKERHIAVSESTADLAVQASFRAVEAAGIPAADLDLIICATMTPDSFMPSTACMVQERLGADNSAAFDLSAACSGFVFGITTAVQYIESGMYRNILVVGAETVSKILDWKDRSTCVLFGDGAGAVVISTETDKCRHGLRVEGARLVSCGKKRGMLTCPALPLQNPFLPALTAMPGAGEAASFLSMDGGEVFKFAVKSIVSLVKEAADMGEKRVEDITYIVPHQANVRIIDQAAKLLKIPETRFYKNLEHYGNTSAASIGLALDELVRGTEIKSGEKIILVGFGGGMTSGALLLEAVCPV